MFFPNSQYQTEDEPAPEILAATEADNTKTDNSEGSAETEAESPSDALSEARKSLTERENQLVQLAADFENYKRQATRRESEVRERTVRGVLEDLLPVLDNFERAVQASQNAKDVDSLRIGLEFIAQQMQETLRGQGVEPIDAVGKMFDPLRHEALEEVPAEDILPGTVVGEVQSGYVYKGQVLRPARVRVAG
jgi:molecular chaperone GrpE